MSVLFFVKKFVIIFLIIEIIFISNEDGKIIGYLLIKIGNIMYILFCCFGVILRICIDVFISRV